MNAISLLIGLLAGVALGALIGCLYARGRLAGEAAAADERARAAHERAALVERAAQERVALTEGKLAEHFQVLAGPAPEPSTPRGPGEATPPRGGPHNPSARRRVP